MLAIVFCFFASLAQSQPLDSLDTAHHVNTKRLHRMVWTSAAGYGVTMVGLHQLWYKDAQQQSFRFFNDNKEWKQVDKMGHFFSGFYFSYGASRALKWCNVPDRKADLAGAITGFAVMIPIEIMDGFSDAYGASAGDLIANASGSLLYLGQARLWNEVRIYPKYSFHRTDYARQRPNVLGDNFFSEALKDYNGQTYWLSVDVDKFTRFPKWLNFAVGYGAEGMIYARDHQNISNGFDQPYRQYYLSLDLDLTAIQTRSKFLKTILFLANMLKLPSPALELSRGEFRFRALAF
jgi:Predicted periplasmic lipoprotein (DUF2279)